MLSQVIRGTWRAGKREYRQRREVVVVRGNGIEERGGLLLSRHRSCVAAVDYTRILCTTDPSCVPLANSARIRECYGAVLFRFQYANPMRSWNSTDSLSAISAVLLAGLSKQGLLCESRVGLRSSRSVTQVHLDC